jgi:hypothetical protein
MDVWAKNEPPVGSIVMTQDDHIAYQRAESGWYSASPIRINVATKWSHLRNGGIIVVLIG